MGEYQWPLEAGQANNDPHLRVREEMETSVLHRLLKSKILPIIGMRKLMKKIDLLLEPSGRRNTACQCFD